jgi:hypothetical protein
VEIGDLRYHKYEIGNVIAALHQITLEFENQNTDEIIGKEPHF